MSQTPTLAEVIKEAQREQQRELHTSIPGVIDSWDNKTGLADIRIAVQGYRPLEDGTMGVRPYAILQSCPVAIPGGGKARASFPLAKGDPVTVHFAEASIDLWLEKGGADVDPQDRRRHNISDPTATPGPRPKQQRWASMSADDASFGVDDQPQFVAKKNGELHLGAREGQAALTEKVVLGSTQKDDFGDMLQSASQACLSIQTAFTTCGIACGVAGGLASTAGSACSAISVLSPAGAGLTGIGVGLIALSTQFPSIAGQFGNLSSAFLQLKGKLSTHLSSVVKVKA